MSTPIRLRRRLRFEPLEPRWTMDAQLCPTGPTDYVDPADSARSVFAPEEISTPASPAEVRQVEQSLNQFALDLYQTIAESDATQPTNAAVSPFSIAAALAMTYAGAQGETASQLARALHIDLPSPRFHAAMQTILQNLLPAEASTAVQLEIANSLWGQSDYPLLDSFGQLLNDRYGADFHEVDFRSAPEEATAAINDWVRAQTRDMIDKLFDQLSNNTRVVLANALYFKASWAEAFDPLTTQRADFHLASGESLDVSMMQKVADFGYTESNDYQIAELPYGGGRYSMVVLLPKQRDASLNADFSAHDLQTWLATLQSTKLSVELPKFKLETSLSLVDTLTSLGITDAFDGRSADFSGINGRRDLYISQAVHKAVVEVSETGTKAAAATGISIGVYSACVCSPPIILPIPFHADHPFHFLVRDRQTDSILFLGQVQEPTPYEGTDSTFIELPKISLEATTNPANRFDVNADGQESPLDAVLVINYLNDQASSPAFQQSAAANGSSFFADVDGSGHIVPLDAVLIINRLNERVRQVAGTASTASAQAEGESAAASARSMESPVDAVFGLDSLAAVTSDFPWHSDRLAARRTS